MPKRMIDTDLWNDDDIIADFTAEDKYFWLYLLTNPHNKMCGVLKNSPSLIARDMGLHKDTIVNLIYRFAKVHNCIYCDNQTNEIFILNWYKYNWTKSPKIISIISKEKGEIKSKYIVSLIDERLAILFEEKREDEENDDTLSIGYGYPSNSISISNSISNSISSIFNYWNGKQIIVHRDITDKIKNAICKALKQYSEEDVILCIERYATIINDKQYFWHYKWSLTDFLSRKDGISSFTDEGSKWNSYRDFLDNPNKHEKQEEENPFDKFNIGVTL